MSCAIHPDVETGSACARCGVTYCDDCLLTILGLIDCVPGLFTKERVTVHDLLARTRVVQAST